MKKVLIFLILLFVVTNLFAFDFVTEIEEISMHPDFWAGVFPSYIAYKLKLQMFEFIPGNETELSVLLSTGIQPRVITQNPINGDPVWVDNWEDGDGNSLNSLKLADYDTMASSWAITFGQGFGERKNESKKDPLLVWASFDGQWEQSLNPILQGLDRKGYPFNNAVFDYTVDENTNKITEFNELVGTPDLQGDRQLLSMSLNLGFNVEMLELNTASIQGVDAKLRFTFGPEKLGNSFTGKSDFIKIWLWAETGFTIFQLKDENALNRMSFVVVDDFEFRFLTGSQIPKWAERTYGTVWNVENINSPIFLRNSTKLYYYGRQFLNGLAVPSFMLFFDLGYNRGNLNNTTSTIPLNFFTGSYGIQINLKMFNFLYIYYEIGHIIWDNPGGSSHFQSSETIKFLIKLNY